jgi:hypothetical protein
MGATQPASCPASQPPSALPYSNRVREQRGYVASRSAGNQRGDGNPDGPPASERQQQDGDERRCQAQSGGSAGRRFAWLSSGVGALDEAVLDHRASRQDRARPRVRRFAAPAVLKRKTGESYSGSTNDSVRPRVAFKLPLLGETPRSRRRCSRTRRARYQCRHPVRAAASRCSGRHRRI